jgi:hypothetical protein
MEAVTVEVEWVDDEMNNRDPAPITRAAYRVSRSSCAVGCSEAMGNEYLPVRMALKHGFAHSTKLGTAIIISLSDFRAG